MLVVLSPAKTMDISACDTSVELTEPSFESCTQELVQILQSYDKAALQKVLSVSAALARQASAHAGSQPTLSA